jgi:hypothetical protein
VFAVVFAPVGIDGADRDGSHGLHRQHLVVDRHNDHNDRNDRADHDGNDSADD